MKRILTGKEAKRVDKYSIEKIGIPSLVLMERAAVSVCNVIGKNVADKKRVLVVCGSGNNGADGIAVARILSTSGYDVTVIECSDKAHRTNDYIYQRELLEYYDVKKYTLRDFDFNDNYEIIIDGIFGIGLSRPVEGEIFELINKLNSLSGVKIAIDCPSGVDCNNGKILGISFNADITVTFGSAKYGLLLYPGAEYTGDVIVEDIGFPDEAYRDIENITYMSDESLLDRLYKREPYSNKGTYGKVAIIAGSKNMCGAAVMAAKACYAMGAGVVKVITCEENREIIQNQVPEAIITTYDSNSIEMLDGDIKWADALLVGPGISTDATAVNLLKKVLDSDKPMVIDADAINILAMDEELLENIRDRQIILTPHLGEMSRLTNISIANIADDIVNVCRKFAKEYGVVCVLKDARTVVSDGYESMINTAGNSGMAKAGSGDVLAGIMAALLANTSQTFDCGCVGVYIHACAGDIARSGKGEYSMSAFDTIECISTVTR